MVDCEGDSKHCGERWKATAMAGHRVDVFLQENMTIDFYSPARPCGAWWSPITATC